MHNHHQQRNALSLHMKIGLAAAGAAVLLYLWFDHRQHLLGWAPYLIFLLCPMMHLFMHKGHGAHQAPAKKEGSQADDKEKCH